MGTMQPPCGQLPHGVLGISKNQDSQISSNGGYSVLLTETLAEKAVQHAIVGQHPALTPWGPWPALPEPTPCTLSQQAFG